MPSLLTSRYNNNTYHANNSITVLGGLTVQAGGELELITYQNSQGNLKQEIDQEEINIQDVNINKTGNYKIAPNPSYNGRFCFVNFNEYDNI